MKKTLHVLAIIAAGAMIMMMTGCASLKGLPVSAPDLAGTVWVEETKTGPLWLPKLNGLKITFIDETQVTRASPIDVLPTKGTYSIVGWNKFPEGTVIDLQVDDVIGAAIRGGVDKATEGTVLEGAGRGEADHYILIKPDIMELVWTTTQGRLTHYTDVRFKKQKQQ
jgi:hypothetical protein